MTDVRAVAVTEPVAELGEGPLWDPVRRRVDWVDITGGRIHHFDPSSGVDSVVDVGAHVGVLAHRAGGGLVLGIAGGFALLDEETGDLERLPRLHPEEWRMNDGLVDSRGRFWAGNMRYDQATGQATLYRLDPDRSVTRVLEGLSLCNGLDWADDGATMYFIDSLAHRVDAYEFDMELGTVGARRTVVEIPDDSSSAHGLTVPDGMTLDAEGYLWVAVFGGAQVRRYHPDGRLDGVIELPVGAVTSCGFAGDDLRDLYITTATHEPAEPLAGALFHCRPGVQGRPSTPFAG